MGMLPVRQEFSTPIERFLGLDISPVSTFPQPGQRASLTRTVPNALGFPQKEWTRWISSDG
jgi:hypothetical protein